MGLPWIRMDTSMFDHPKMLGLFDSGDYRAVVVHLAAMAYCGKHSTSGFIPREVLRRIEGRVTEARRLVEADLWTENAGGWDINGWDEYQLSDEDAVKRREKAKNAAAIRWSKREAAKVSDLHKRSS
jgi:hypothetical protein